MCVWLNLKVVKKNRKLGVNTRDFVPIDRYKTVLNFVDSDILEVRLNGCLPADAHSHIIMSKNQRAYLAFVQLDLCQTSITIVNRSVFVHDSPCDLLLNESLVKLVQRIVSGQHKTSTAAAAFGEKLGKSQ